MLYAVLPLAALGAPAPVHYMHLQEAIMQPPLADAFHGSPHATATPASPVSHATSLVIISDHSSGATEFGQALNTHPCMFDLGETFKITDTIWASSQVEECNDPKAPGMATDMSRPLFDAATGLLIKNSNPALSERLMSPSISAHAAVNGTIMGPGGIPIPKRHVAHLTMEKDSPTLYAGLHYKLSEYVTRTRDHVCKNVPADVCAPADCAITTPLPAARPLAFTTSGAGCARTHCRSKVARVNVRYAAVGMRCRTRNSFV